ncbi:hypothetical protein ACJX0J_035211 [Zea mays]
MTIVTTIILMGGGFQALEVKKDIVVEKFIFWCYMWFCEHNLENCMGQSCRDCFFLLCLEHSPLIDLFGTSRSMIMYIVIAYITICARDFALIFSLTFLAWISLFIFFFTANMREKSMRAHSTQHLKSKELHYALSTLIEEYFSTKFRIGTPYQPYTIHILLHKNFFIFIFGLSHGFLLEHFVILCCAYQCFCFHFSFSGLLKNIFQMSTICLFGFNHNYQFGLSLLHFRN